MGFQNQYKTYSVTTTTPHLLKRVSKINEEYRSVTTRISSSSLSLFSNFQPTAVKFFTMAETEDIIAPVSTTFLSSITSLFFPFALRVGSILVALIAVAGGILYVKQDNLLYFPEIDGIPRHNKDNPRGYRSPAYHNWPFEEHRIECSDGVQIHSWLLLGDVKASKTKALPTIIYFHGNAGNIGLHIPSALQMAVQLERKVNILLVEYRGYGDSDNIPPSEAGLKLDAEAAIQFCLKHNKIDSSKLFLFGRSLGGAVAFHLAQVCYQQSIPIAGIIVENTFLSISAMVDSLMPKIIVLLKPLVLRMKWDSESIVPTLKNIPVLYLSGSKDELVPPHHMSKLYQLSKQHTENVRIHFVEDGTHNDTWMRGGQPYWDAIRNFVLSSITGTPLTSSTSNLSTGADSTITGGVSSSIPTTSSNVFGMFKDALGSTTTTTSSSSVDEKRKDL